MSEIKYTDLKKGGVGFAVIEIKKNHAQIRALFTSYSEANEALSQYKLLCENYEVTEIKR